MDSSLDSDDEDSETSKNLREEDIPGASMGGRDVALLKMSSDGCYVEEHQ